MWGGGGKLVVVEELGIFFFSLSLFALRLVGRRPEKGLKGSKRGGKGNHVLPPLVTQRARKGSKKKDG